MIDADKNFLNDSYRTLGQKYLSQLQTNMQVTSTLTIPFYTDVFEVNDKLSQSLVEEVILACASDTDASTVVGVVGSATESDLKRLGRIIGNYEGIFGRYLSLSAEEKQDEMVNCKMKLNT